MSVTHKRWWCADCKVQWVWRTPDSGPPGNCPRCGSEQLTGETVHGVFDLGTDPDDVGRILGSVPDESLAQMAIFDGATPIVSAPPVALTASAWPPPWVSWGTA